MTEKVVDPSYYSHPRLWQLFQGRSNPYVHVQHRPTVALMLEQEEDEVLNEAHGTAEIQSMVKMEMDVSDEGHGTAEIQSVVKMEMNE